MGTTESILNDVSEKGPSTRPKKPPLPVLRLQGCVLGLSQSGKQTLLTRLEGKDPFRDAMDDHSERTVTVVPYQAPAVIVWDRIHLVVQVTRLVSTTVDFCILLINPTHEVTRIRKYMADAVQSLVEEQQGDADEPSRPVCLCVLLNFRDRQESKLTVDDVETFTKQLLQKYGVDSSRAVLYCGQVSLYNCYGLDSLHHFIYMSYLQRKQYDTEELLRVIQKSAAQVTIPQQSYEAFLGSIGQGKRLGGTHRRSGESAPNKQPLPAVMPPQNESPKVSVAENKVPDRPSVTEQRRNILPPKKSPAPAKPQPRPVDARAALEAFLASDSEEEAPEQKTRRVDSEDDSDDEFFYDETGKRSHVCPTVRPVAASSDDEDERGAAKGMPDAEAAQALNDRPVAPEKKQGNRRSHSESENDVEEQSLAANKPPSKSAEADGTHEVLEHPKENGAVTDHDVDGSATLADSGGEGIVATLTSSPAHERGGEPSQNGSAAADENPPRNKGGDSDDDDDFVIDIAATAVAVVQAPPSPKPPSPSSTQSDAKSPSVLSAAALAAIAQAQKQAEIMLHQAFDDQNHLKKAKKDKKKSEKKTRKEKKEKKCSRRESASP